LHDEAQLTERSAAPSQSVELCTRQVEKPWGREELPEPFNGRSAGKVGEIWFEHPEGARLPLLVKYIFTSEKLSVQGHPDDAQARDRGLERGKTECWYILDAQPDARLGLGLTRELSAEEIRAAALDGSIEHLMDWKPVRAGDFVFVPAGTIHAIGAGISLLEFQQNVDVTYRLYDYGRPRELHLDEATQVSRPDFDNAHFTPAAKADGVLASNPHFSLVRMNGADDLPDLIVDRRRWVMPLSGTATAGAASVDAGGCLLAAPGEPLTLSPSATVLVGVEGPLQNS
jgi:mannose-6-phosphate isomerase